MRFLHKIQTKLKNIQNSRGLFLTIDKLFYLLLMRHRTTFIMKEDWDNLIILDACRYDMFKEISTLEGRLRYIYSKGSSTTHFLDENFKGKNFPDTVYVTANPLVNYYSEDSFYRVIPVWKDGWHEPYQTVLPETMVEYSLKAIKEYPDKRLIIHFMQPHFPFIEERTRKMIGEHEGFMSRNIFYGKEAQHTQTVWHLFSMGKLDRKTVWEAYEANLRIALEHVKKLLEKLEGKTVITSDHANLFGEWLLPFPLKEYGHPGGIYKKSAIKVPWFMIEKRERKEILRGEKRERDTRIEDEARKIKRRLEDLGYL